MPLPNTRQLFGLIFLFCCGLMAVGYYMQYMMEMEPCPLCMTQRFFIVLTGVIALLICLLNPARRASIVGGSLVTLSAIAGGFFSSRQLWLQSLPEDQVPACGPSIDYVLENFPLSKALEILLRGDGNCAEISWSFLGLTIPGWTLVAFVMMALTGLYLAAKGNRAPGA